MKANQRLRNAAFKRMDVEWFRLNLLAAGVPPMSSETVLLASIHKARYECTDMPDALRHESRAWLEQHGFSRYWSAPWPPKGELEK